MIFAIFTRARLVSYWLLAVLVACGPKAREPVPDDAAERYATAMCASYARCGCMGEGYDDEDTCLAETKKLFERVEALPGVRFDVSCFERVLEYVGDDTCALAGEDTLKAVPCLAFAGTQEIGASCPEWEWEHSGGHLTAGSCSGSAICSAGTCVNPPAASVGLGEPCHLELGVRCGQGAYCASDGLCRAKVVTGEPCDTPRACLSDDTYCAGLADGEGQGECRAPIALGEPCDPNEIEACSPASISAFCSSDGICTEGWPVLCRSLTPAPDEYNAREWIPWSEP